MILGLVAAVIVAPLLFNLGSPPPAPTQDGLPWQVTTSADGNSRVFGLNLGKGSLEDARARLAPDVQIGIIARGEEAGALEAYQDNLPPGFIGGRIIVTGDLSAETIRAMKSRAAVGKYMASGAQRFTLNPDDMATALRAPIKAISFIPAANLDAQTVVARFGHPVERIKTTEHTEHLLYPEKGLDAIVDSEGKELLQYVPPREFNTLRTPLVAIKPEPK